MLLSYRPWGAFVLGIAAWAHLGCGGRSSSAPPVVVVSVSVGSGVVNLTNDGSAVYIPVTIIAPTETATFTIAGLPGGVTASYKESESNPSGLLTLTATAATVPGTSMPQITVGSSGQTASVGFTLVVLAASK